MTDEFGNEYYHMIMGSLADGFIQEVYIACHASQLYTRSGGMMSNVEGAVSASGDASDFGNGSNNLNPLGRNLDVTSSGSSVVV